MTSRVRREIRLIEEEDGGWSAIDTQVGVASGGDSREEALAMLDEAVELHTGDSGEPIEDEEAFLREIGIDPDEVPDAPEPLPDFMK